MHWISNYIIVLTLYSYSPYRSSSFYKTFAIKYVFFELCNYCSDACCHIWVTSISICLISLMSDRNKISSNAECPTWVTFPKLCTNAIFKNYDSIYVFFDDQAVWKNTQKFVVHYKIVQVVKGWIKIPKKLFHN